MHGGNTKTRYFGLILILQFKRDWTFYQTRSNAIIPRPPPKISFQHDHDWTRGKVQLGSTINWSQPEGKVVRSLEEKFNTQRSPNLPNQSQNQSVIDQCNLIICLKIPVLNKLTMDQGNLTAQVHGQWKNNMLLTNIVKLRHSTRTTSSIVQSTRGTLTSTFQAYRIPQWNNNTAQRSRLDSKKSRTTRIGTLFNETYNEVNHSIPSAKNQKKWFMKLGTSNCVNYSIWNPKPSPKYVYHTGTSASSIARAGTSRATERRRTRNLSSTPWIFFRFRITTSRKGDPTGTDRHEKKPGDYQYFVANSLKKKCKKKNFLGIHDRIIRDEKFRNVGRSEELCRVHTHHITAEEISVYRNNWWLRQLVPIRSMPVRRRADLKQALSTLRLLKHQENTAH